MHVNRHDMKSYEKEIRKLVKKFDNEEAISYIDSIYSPLTFSKPFGYSDLIKRKKQRRKLRKQQELENAQNTTQGMSQGTGGSASGGTSGGY